MATILVQNNTEEDLLDKFDGIQYVFKAGESLLVPEEVAAHIFGYGEDDKLRAMHRLGWVQSSTDLEKGTSRLAKFVFLDPNAESSCSSLEDVATGGDSSPEGDPQNPEKKQRGRPPKTQ